MSMNFRIRSAAAAATGDRESPGLPCQCPVTRNLKVGHEWPLVEIARPGAGTARDRDRYGDAGHDAMMCRGSLRLARSRTRTRTRRPRPVSGWPDSESGHADRISRSSILSRPVTRSRLRPQSRRIGSLTQPRGGSRANRGPALKSKSHSSSPAELRPGPGTAGPGPTRTTPWMAPCAA